MKKGTACLTLTELAITLYYSIIQVLKYYNPSSLYHVKNTIDHSQVKGSMADNCAHNRPRILPAFKKQEADKEHAEYPDYSRNCEEIPFIIDEYQTEM